MNGVSITHSLPTNSNWGSITATGNINTFFIVGTDFLVDNLNATLLAGLSGDYNKNHVVDAGDYALWRKNLNSRSGYNSWRSNFGAVGRCRDESSQARVFLNLPHWHYCSLVCSVIAIQRRAGRVAALSVMIGGC